MGKRTGLKDYKSTDFGSGEAIKVDDKETFKRRSIMVAIISGIIFGVVLGNERNFVNVLIKIC